MTKIPPEDAIEILVIDDEPFFVDIYSTALKRAGFCVLSARDGIEGLALAIEKLPSLILLDILMPDKDGFQVMADLKACTETREIPVFILSALTKDLEVRRGIKLGATRYLLKGQSTPMQVADQIHKYFDEVRREN